LAYRKPEWLAIEDKVVVDDIFDAAGVTRSPRRIVAIDDLAWTGTHEVWAGDARSGFHGGAEQTHWVANAADAEAARVALSRECDTARVMPFLEGIPCAIHGMVVGEDVIALRPVEMVTLRRPSAPHFFYAGAATFWDPPDTDREAMRVVAYRVGAELARRAAFQGAFTVDGVLTVDGFRPTEVNARMGAGINMVARGVDEIPLVLLIAAISGGVELVYRPSDLEAVLVERADAQRRGGTWRVIPETVPAIDSRPVDWKGGRWVDASDASSDGTMMSGPSEVSGFLRLMLNPGRTTAGPSVGNKAAAFYAFCDTELGTHIGPLEAAPDVRA
jgi:hypothetical protein